jgi:hypothetical protein
MNHLVQQSDRFRRAAEVEAETPITAGAVPFAHPQRWVIAVADQLQTGQQTLAAHVADPG